MKKLVCYFSASGVTKSVALKIAEKISGDLFEIIPTKSYTEEDLDWRNPNSRSSVEMKDTSSRPSIAKKVENLEEYDTVVIGFPVWWYTAPTIINTFIEENDLSGKDIYLFVTSGGSSAEGSLKNLKETYPNLNFIKADRFTGREEDYSLGIKN